MGQYMAIYVHMRPIGKPCDTNVHEDLVLLKIQDLTFCWPYIPIYGHIHGYVWPYTAIYGHIFGHIYGHIRPYVAIYCHI